MRQLKIWTYVHRAVKIEEKPYRGITEKLYSGTALVMMVILVNSDGDTCSVLGTEECSLCEVLFVLSCKVSHCYYLHFIAEEPEV